MTIPSLPFFSLPDNHFYDFNYNFIEAPHINGVSVYCIVYLFLAIFMLAIFVVQKIRHKLLNLDKKLLIVCWVFLGIIALFQTAHQSWFLFTAHKNIGHLSDDQRFSIFFGYSYELARATVLRVAPGSSGIIAAGEVEDIFAVLLLRYFLFPSLDVIHKSDTPKYIVVFMNSDFQLPVTGSFRPLIIDRHNPTRLLERIEDGR